VHAVVNCSVSISDSVIVLVITSYKDAINSIQTPSIVTYHVTILFSNLIGKYDFRIDVLTN
jgi:hypothetical protein